MVARVGVVGVAVDVCGMAPMSIVVEAVVAAAEEAVDRRGKHRVKCMLTVADRRRWAEGCRSAAFEVVLEAVASYHPVREDTGVIEVLAVGMVELEELWE